MSSELEKLHEMDTYVPLNDNKHTKGGISETLASIMFLTEKVMVELKG